MDSEEQSLALGLGFSPPPKPTTTNKCDKKFVEVDDSPSLTLTLSGEAYQRKLGEEQPCSVSAASSLSNYTPANLLSVKRERETASYEDLEVERVSSRASDEEEDGGSGPTTAAAAASTRKKLRLTKDQSALLEESFKQHSTLNPKQKQALADRLNLRPRQVEVWFQNRRARTKLKQTEVDCEYLKKCCETLTDENRRLQKELQELKAMKLAAPPPFYMHLPAATLTMCPSCERIGASTVPIAGGTSPPKSPFTVGPTKSQYLYTSFPNPSAAC